MVEADHGNLKLLIKPVRGFKTLKTAYATIKGFEVLWALHKDQAAIFNLTCDTRGEARTKPLERGVGRPINNRSKFLRKSQTRCTNAFVRTLRSTRRWQADDQYGSAILPPIMRHQSRHSCKRIPTGPLLLPAFGEYPLAQKRSYLPYPEHPPRCAALITTFLCLAGWVIDHLRKQSRHCLASVHLPAE